MVALLPTVVFNLVVLRAERIPVAHLNDSAMHEQMARFARAKLEAGDLPLHAWYPSLQLGLPHFQHYPSLGHTVAGGLSALTGSDSVYQWLVYLTLALFPLSVYKAARVLEMNAVGAVAAATVATLAVSEPGYGQELSSYVWRGYGVWGQMLAMAVLPLAVAYGWRAMKYGRGYARAAALLGLTMLLHFLTGWLGAVTLGTLALLAPRRAVTRLRRIVGVLVAAVCVASFELVPLMRGSRFTAYGDAPRGTFFLDSFGARRILGWLVSGELYDAGRLPVLTVLVGIGVVVSAVRWRHDERARVLLTFWLLSLLLFFGPVTWGSLLERLPGGSTVLFHRFVFGVHLAGFLLAGLAVANIVALAAYAVRRFRPAWPARTGPAVALVVVAVALVPAWRSTATYAVEGGDMIATQRVYEDHAGRDVRALIELATAAQDGRVYAGMRSNWGTQYLVGYVPVYAMLADADADAVGFTYRAPSLMSDIEAYFDERNPAQYDVFGIRYLLLPADREPPVPATKVASRGQHTLWTVASTGYLRAVDTTSTLSLDRESLNVAARTFLSSPDLPAGRFSAIAFDGLDAPPPTLSGTLAQRPPGRVLTSVAVLDEGHFAARVELERPAMVALKVAYNPQWQAYVDGERQPLVMLSPALAGVRVPAGAHAVSFRFRSTTPTWAFVLLGAVALLIAWYAGRPRPGRVS